MHVVYASDLAMGTDLLAAMISVGKNLKDPEHCIIHLVVPPHKISTASKLVSCFGRELKRLNRTAPQVQTHEVKMHPIDIAGRFAQGQHVMGITRLFLHEYLPEASRAIWLDTDTIVTADLATLYRSPLEHPVAAVREGAPRTLRVLYPAQNWGQLRRFVPNPDLLVFNAGVLLFDLDKWRSNEMRKAVQDWANLLKTAGPQLLLNLACQVGQNFTELDWQWNVFGLGGHFPPRLEKAQQAHILHWSGRNKPWTRNLEQPRATINGALHKAGVRLPDLGHEKFDYLLIPYMPSRKCSEPTFVPM